MRVGAEDRKAFCQSKEQVMHRKTPTFGKRKRPEG